MPRRVDGGGVSPHAGDPIPRDGSSPRDELLFPELTKAGFAEALKPITRKNNLRAVARFRRDAPVLVCVETIRRAKAVSGLTTKDIAELIGKDRKTVAAALRADPNTSLYTFCEVMNVIGLDVAEVFPMRRKKAVNAPVWQRGYHSDANLENVKAQIRSQREGRRRKW